MYKVILADDHENSLFLLNYFVEKHSEFIIVDSCRDGQELVEKVKIHMPDVIITDINMPVKSGMEAARECLEFAADAKVIFVTGYEEFAVEAYTIEAVDYIVKPLSQARINEALKRAQQRIQLDGRKIEIQEKDKIIYLSCEEILFVEKSGKSCLFHTFDRTYTVSGTIRFFSEKLGDAFFLSHRSFLINSEKVSEIRQDKEIYLAKFGDYGHVAHISRLKFKEAQKKIREAHSN
ncbi:response regulator transcription factor [Rossellomorea vietnamensis]|uniref:Response regulator transcription factor n=1 Tax=Rossellomorea vietnamensis TaxID=218284 RepID=A0A5D4MB92_9BACI|nr:LytTR family DNA-binding domain-containing protein [Rossellomorea vietnamensis]TYR98861.1 response regulator transcription factor [Rossellomorea vietnamensis]